MSDSLSGTFSDRALDSPADPTESLHKVKAVDRDTPREDTDSKNEEQAGTPREKGRRLLRKDRIELSEAALRAAHAPGAEPPGSGENSSRESTGAPVPFAGTA